jgi:hypothetical protein
MSIAQLYGRRNGAILTPAAESRMSVANRRERVSSLFALITQKTAVRRYEGG